MDEEQTGGYSDICGQCGEVNWGVSDEGRFYCRSCHNVIERTKEVVDTNTFMVGTSRVSSISKGTRRKKLEQGREWMVCEGFQFILKHQAEALLAMGVCPQFKDDVLCQFWRMYLQKSRQAYTKNPVHDGKFRLRSQGSGESDSAPESSVMSDSMMSASETDGDGDWASGGGSVSGHTSDGASSVCSGSIDAVSYLTPRQRRSQGLMSMPKTLALCHLALLWAREAITLADLLRFVNEGHIPYVNAYEDFPEEMKLYGRDSLIFRVESIPSYSHLHKEAQALAVFLELPLFPPITLDCLLHPSLLTLRYLTEANLPDELHDWVCRIMEKAGMESSVTFEPMRSRSPLPHYDVQAAALIIIAMKLLFKLDDHTEWDLSNDASDKNKENPDGNSFNLRWWYRTMQTALTTAARRQQDNIARKHWKPQKPLYTSKKDKSVVLKRRRIAEQLQLSFQKLSSSPVAPPSTPPSSFCFRWGEEGEEVWDGPSLHHLTLDSSVRQRGASLQPANPEYWHPALRACKPRKRGVLVLQNEPSYSGGQRQAFTEDDEAWRAFLENPLTAASKAMMSINGDEDSANALGLLYDYYKVPRDRRTAGQPKTEVLLGDTDPNKINVMMPLQDSPLRAVPRNTAAKGSSQPSRGDKIRALYPASDSIVCLSSPPSYSISTGRTLALHSFPVGLPPGPHSSHSSQSDGMAFSHQLNHSQYSPRAKSLTPDSTYTEPYKDSSNEVFPLSEELQQRMTSIPPGGYPYYSLTASQHFEYMLEAPQSIRPKSGSGQMSYLNKGQFYPITLRELGGPTVLPHLNGAFRSVVMLVFGEEKFTEDQLKHWRYWHSRQHTAKQRCIDIADYKESFNTIASIEEIAYNAISFTWDTKDEPRVFVSVNCLSTDFSPQKGVRGLPLNLQIDTYSCGGHGDKLVHRAYCQIKVFCDKGAERKIRDEERKQTQRKGRGQETTAACVEDPLKLKHVDITSFKAMSDMNSQPVLFIPEVYFPSTQRHHTCISDDGEDGLGQKRLLHYDEEFDSATHKRARREEPEKVLLYVRKETEEVFDALMLRTPTLAGLLEAVSDKYELPLGKMGKVYKRCKKGILVHMDDNIIKHYSNEDAFHIRMEEVGGKVLLTLTEI